MNSTDPTERAIVTANMRAIVLDSLWARTLKSVAREHEAIDNLNGSVTVTAECMERFAAALASPRPAEPAGEIARLSDAQIVEIRDEHLPNQGDSFDCIAFAHAILAATMPWKPVPPRACIKPTHEAADAFWAYWRENGETHKHGYYESTWGAINKALAFGWVAPDQGRRP